MRHIVGHINPDTDTIASAIVYSKLLNKQGIESKPVRLGELNKETEYLLNELNIKSPELIEKLPENSQVVLVDHNEYSQSISNIEELDIVGIIDHHKFNTKTQNPVYIRAEPIGSTCTIIYKLYKEAGIELEKIDAQLLISAIISDTLFFRSPTTTEEDRLIMEELNKIAEYESLEKHSLNMFNAKSDLGNMPVEELIKLDYKIFNFGGNDYGIGFMETTNAQYGINRKDEINQALKEIKKKDNLKGIFFSIVDILNEENFTLYSGNTEKELLITLFNATIENNIANLGNIISRKKQVVPKFEQHFNN